MLLKTGFTVTKFSTRLIINLIANLQTDCDFTQASPERILSFQSLNMDRRTAMMLKKKI